MQRLKRVSNSFKHFSNVFQTPFKFSAFQMQKRFLWRLKRQINMSIIIITELRSPEDNIVYDSFPTLERFHRTSRKGVTLQNI